MKRSGKKWFTIMMVAQLTLALPAAAAPAAQGDQTAFAALPQGLSEVLEADAPAKPSAPGSDLAPIGAFRYRNGCGQRNRHL